ncbi:M61 family metallopeptidase [Sphingomonas sp. MMS12-HWE2-04]|uniref:M61 family metallopeptidase n=1 Tax=Sphingomonas sp. MMS12-HWE2-04 TaxID=3234199 RepID=UPI0038515EC9
MPKLFAVALALSAPIVIGAAVPTDSVPVYTLGMRDPAHQLFDVALDVTARGQDFTLVMPVWTPGYYQRMDYADKVRGFAVTDVGGRPVSWRRDGSRWHIAAPSGTRLRVHYQVLADRDFVAANFLDANKGYVSPAGVFAYPEGRLHAPVELRIVPQPGWTVATGLAPLGKAANVWRAPDFDILYDSPILIGKLERLPSFRIRGVPHHVIGTGFGTIDRPQLVSDLEKIVTAAVEMMGDIPYRDYSFIGIGPTQGGIEHLNSTSFGFGRQDNRTPAGRLRLDAFLAHEYFHHFNVKRIRPIELGPFDYGRENRTRQLWVSEGLTVYYENILLRRAGLIDTSAFLDDLSGNLRAYENAPGHRYQSLAQASYETWEDGPFGRKDDDFNKTISYYDKGPVVGFMLDLAIRHATANRRSLDDVMRALYRDYYQRLGRGFTEREFRATCEAIAGTSLADLFAYVDTTADPDYARYFGYAGLAVDMRPHALPGGWLGIALDSAQPGRIADVEWDSPAWKAGVRRGDLVLRSDLAKIAPLLPDEAQGRPVALTIGHQGAERRVDLTLDTKRERRFTLTPMPHADALQRRILASF